MEKADWIRHGPRPSVASSLTTKPRTRGVKYSLVRGIKNSDSLVSENIIN